MQTEHEGDAQMKCVLVVTTRCNIFLVRRNPGAKSEPRYAQISESHLGEKWI